MAFLEKGGNLKAYYTVYHFTFVAADFYNDSGFNLYSLSLSMKLNIPKFQCSFTLLTTGCTVGGVTSRYFSLLFLNI